MSINLSIPEKTVERELKPRITVVGVGGAGGNAVNDMINSELEGVEFLVVNTDAQSLKGSGAQRRVQMGASITSGLGAGASPEIGHAAAEESLPEIMEHLDGANMVFIAAGMGGGTGTGGAPVIAKAAREKGILTVGVVTKPFHFEGSHRMKLAEKGIEDLAEFVDTLIVIPNQNLFRVANEKTTFADAFRMADEVLYSGVRGVTDLIIMPGMINLDFADIRSVMHEMGKAMMGTGEADGERRALDAAEAAIANPLLDDCSMKGAKGVLINITGGSDMTLFEVDEAANRIRAEVDEEAYIIFGSAFESELEGRIRVSVVATGLDSDVVERSIPTATSVMASTPVKSAPVTNAPEVLRVEDEASEPVVETAEMALEVAFAATEEEPEAAQTPLSFSMLKQAISEPSAVVEEQVTEDSTADSKVETETVAATLENAAESHIAVTPDLESTNEAAIEGELAAELDTAASDIDVALEPSAAPLAEMPTVSDTVPTAMPSASTSDAFIPPAPALANGKEETVPTKPFAESDFVNGASEPAAVVSEATTRKPAIKRAGSLFKTILGANKPVAPQPLDWQGQAGQTADASVATATTTTTAATATTTAATAPQFGPAPVSGTAIGSAQPSLGVIEQPESQPISETEDDLLDIPAFLRRQAN
ncbi:MAG: cell division protein FtsZ [Rhodospirillales bacterium]|jgi:cell division protein FtsZ|nr:cell division protein FtsZ [Rhodospirillales bacterium]